MLLKPIRCDTGRKTSSPLNLPHFPQVLEDATGGGAVLEVAGADKLAQRARPMLAPIAEHLRAAHGELARRAAAKSTEKLMNAQT